MPQLANITIKKNDGTTDIVWSGVVASSGDKTPAIWRSNSVGTAASHRPKLEVTARANATKTVRRTDIAVSFPETSVGGDGVTRVINTGSFTASFATPEGMADSARDEFVSQTANLIASTLMKDVVKGGYSAT